MPKLLWMSPYSLHDISSGASIHCRYILESLQQAGFEVWAFSSFVFDRPYGGTTTFGDLEKLYERQPEARIFELNDRGLHYIYLKNKTTTEMQRSCNEQMEYFERFCEILDLYKPDIVLGYGTGMDSYTCFAEAKRRGIATVYLLLNGKHGHFSFPHLDLVLTDSNTTAQLYAQRDHINCTPIGQFINPKYVVAKEKKPQYVTMVNPDFAKGVSITAKLAQRCAEVMPDLKFLVVNSRSNFMTNVQYLHSKDDTEQHPFAAQSFPNVLMCQSTHDMRLVYEQTKVALVPSLSYESWGRIVSEALLNDIPVLSSNIGGLPEALNGGGIALAPPQHCLEDLTSLPSDEEIEPWVQALQRLLNEDWSEKVKQARTNVDLPLLTRNLINILIPLCQQRSPRYHQRAYRGDHI